MNWSQKFSATNITQNAGELVKQARLSGGRRKTRRGGCGCKGGSRRRKSTRRYR